MYRERLIATEVHSENAHRLKRLLLEYHDFRQFKTNHPLQEGTRRLADWQAERLKTTHQDLYHHPGYHTGLEFLLSDLYAPAGMTRRDDNVDRIFPKMVKWLPDHLLGTFAGLVELNLVTQSLDLELAEWFDKNNRSTQQITPEDWCEGYRASGQLPVRKRQLELVSDTGQELDRYVRNRTLGWLLSMTRGTAERAGLGDLHSFIHRGYSAFRK
ncbi:FFLEELY motif protein, partial [Marinobacter sp.]|uniref:FFLEELY motif protein n=1 Tax=Marinobacter sp. TaxID=50741 RepID=UPI003569B31D